MNLSADKLLFEKRLSDFSADPTDTPKMLAYFSTAVTFSDEKQLEQLLLLGKQNNIKRQFFYEIVLMSYLFLGFPRMLNAAIVLDKIYPNTENSNTGAITAEEAQNWFEAGHKLCAQVYKDKYEPLKKRFEKIAPEVYRWMIVEGYGKVLSREGMAIKDRELAIIVFLMLENRPKQLESHIRGFFNVGGEPSELNLVLEELGEIAGDGYHSARKIISEVA